MKKEKHEHGYYKKSRLKMFMVNNPWPYRGDRWRKIENFDIQNYVLVNHYLYETKNILIGGNTIYTGPDEIDYDIPKKEN